MKVLQVLPTLSAGGAEGFVTNLGVGLAKQGVEVRFFLMAGVRGDRGQVLLSRLSQAGIKVEGAEEHNVRSPMNIIQLADLIRSWKPDIVQANMYQTEVLLCLSRMLTLGGGSCYVRRLANTEQIGSRSRTIVRLMPFFFRKTIACSTAVAEAYKVFKGKDCKNELVTIANGGLLQEAVTTEEEKRKAREELGFSQNAFVVVHIGRMVEGGKDNGIQNSQKAHDVLIKSFAQAFRGNPDHILILVGDGPLRSELEAITRDLGIAIQVRFLGQQSEPWLALKAADMFFFPSRYEGLPNVLPEAASCGLPVLASDIPEIQSLYPGDAWLLKPVDDIDAFADGLLTINNNLELFVRRAQDVADAFRWRFSMRECVSKYLHAYSSVIDRVKG